MNDWINQYANIWLFWILMGELMAGIYTSVVVTLEYFYDANKDAQKKQRKTRTSKKVTEQRDGGKVTEEVTEVSEPMKEDIRDEHNN